MTKLVNQYAARKGADFYMLLLLLFFDYFRPQSILVFLKPLRIPMILILLLTIRGLQQKKWDLSATATKSFIAIIIVCIAYVPFAVNNFYAYEMTRSLIIYFLTYVAIISFVDTYDKLTVFLKFWLFLGVIIAFKGTLEGGKIIGSGFLGDENDFALYLDMMIPIAFIWMFSKFSPKSHKKWYLLALVALLFGIVSSFSRGGLVGLVGVSFYCWLVSSRKILIAFVVAIALVVTFQYLPQEYVDDMNTIRQGAEESTAGERVYSWKCGMQMFYAYPLFGVGPGNFPWRFAEFEPPEKWKGRSHGGRAAHSLYFTVIPEWGLWGSVCFVLMIVSPWLEARKIRKRYIAINNAKEGSGGLSQEEVARYDELRKIIYGALFGYLFAGIFVSVLYYPHFWIITALLVAINRVIKTESLKISTGTSQPIHEKSLR